MQFLVLVLMVHMVSSASLQYVCYVKPNDSSSCPDQPCLTLDQYASQGAKYFTTGTTFQFLDGNHSMHSTVYLQNVSDVILSGKDSQVTVLCKAGSIIRCENTANLTIQYITFMLYTADNLSAISFFESNNISFFNLIFQGTSDLAETLVRAAYCNHSEVVIVNCLFEGNTGYYGGAVFASGGSNITLVGVAFNENKAKHSGGAIFVNGSSLLLNGSNTFAQNSAVKDGGGLCFLNSKIGIARSDATKPTDDSSMASETKEQVWQYSGHTPMLLVSQLDHCNNFSNNKAEYGGAIYFAKSVGSLSWGVTIFHNNSAQYGGAIASLESMLTTNTKFLRFTANRAQVYGGAFYGRNGSYHHETNVLHFDNNSAVHQGGAIYYQSGYLSLAGRASFTNNHAENTSSGAGGAILCAYNTTALFNGSAIDFVNNLGYTGGGAVGLYNSMLVMNTKRVSFVNNKAYGPGGGLLVASLSELQVNKTGQLEFIGNWAYKGGGLECIYSYCNIMSASYINNTGKFGGGSISVLNGSLYHHDANITGSSDIAIDLLEANVSFSGNVKISKNFGSTGGIATFETGGGCIRAMVSYISFTGLTVFEDNHATTNGGAITLLLKTTLIFSGIVIFSNNNANQNGGAIFATDSKIISNGNITFTSNRAQNGGAMYFENGATMTLEQHSVLTTSYNYATKYGGAIYHSDAITPSQCKLQSGSILSSDSIEQAAILLPSCFIDVVLLLNNTADYFLIASINDSAGNDGNFLYGGLLDKCQILVLNNSIKGEVHVNVTLFYTILVNPNISSITSMPINKPITSEPYELCFCETFHEYDCPEVKTVQTYRGTKFIVSLLALAQGRTISSTSVRAKPSITARVEQNQIVQLLPENCSDIPCIPPRNWRNWCSI